MGLILYEPINSAMRMDQAMDRVRPSFDATYRDTLDRTPGIGSTVLYDRYDNEFRRADPPQRMYGSSYWHSHSPDSYRRF